MGTSTWTEERINKIIDGWNRGLTTAAIADDVGLTKNSVLSKLKRLYANGDKRFIRRFGRDVDHRPWTDDECLDLLAIRDIKRPAEKWAWGDVAKYFGRTISQCQHQHRNILNDLKASEAA